MRITLQCWRKTYLGLAAFMCFCENKCVVINVSMLDPVHDVEVCPRPTASWCFFS